MSLAIQLKRIGASLITLALTTALAWAQEHGDEAGGEHGAAGAHGAAHEAVNPLAEHPASYYSFMAMGVGLAIVFFFGMRAKNLSARNPSRGQLLAEQAVASMQHFCRGAIGPGGEKFNHLREDFLSILTREGQSHLGIQEAKFHAKIIAAAGKLDCEVFLPFGQSLQGRGQLQGSARNTLQRLLAQNTHEPRCKHVHPKKTKVMPRAKPRNH